MPNRCQKKHLTQIKTRNNSSSRFNAIWYQIEASATKKLYDLTGQKSSAFLSSNETVHIDISDHGYIVC